MKSSLLERGVEAFGGMESQDLTSTLQNQIDRMSDDDVTATILETKRAIDALSASFHMFAADFDPLDARTPGQRRADALINLILLYRKHHTAVHEGCRAPPIAA